MPILGNIARALALATKSAITPEQVGEAMREGLDAWGRNPASRGPAERPGWPTWAWFAIVVIVGVGSFLLGRYLATDFVVPG